jgi:CDP-diacylglycerol--serine O-phosphatidyltransferase
MRTEGMIPKPKRTEEAQSTSLLKLIKPADLLSVLNALLGLAAIVVVLGVGGTSVIERALETALILILLAAVVDGLDGTIARTMGSSPIGKYLDSLADMISFGVSPAIVAYVLVLSESYLSGTSAYRDLVLAFCGAYVICGMLRLARFDANHTLKGVPNEQDADFEGFPITGSATFLAVIMLLILELRLPPSSTALILMGLMGLLCLLMTSRIRYRNLRDKRITIPTGLVFLTLFALYLLSSVFVYPVLVVAILTAFYMLTPFARVFPPALR